MSAKIFENSITYDRGTEPDQMKPLFAKRRNIYDAAKKQYNAVDAEIAEVAAKLVGLPSGKCYRVGVTNWGALRLSVVDAPKAGSAKGTTTADLSQLIAALKG